MACTLLSRGGHAVWHRGAGVVMWNSNTEEKDTVGSILCKQLYEMWECKFLKNFVNMHGSDA